MTSQAKRITAICLISLAVVLTIGAGLLWQKASDDAEHEQLVSEYVETLGGGPAKEVEANRAPSLVLTGLAAVSLLSGVIFLASTKPDDDG